MNAKRIPNEQWIEAYRHKGMAETVGRCEAKAIKKATATTGSSSYMYGASGYREIEIEAHKLVLSDEILVESVKRCKRTSHWDEDVENANKSTLMATMSRQLTETLTDKLSEVIAGR